MYKLKKEGSNMIKIKSQRKIQIVIILLLCMIVSIGCENSLNSVKQTVVQAQAHTSDKTNSNVIPSKDVEEKGEKMHNWDTPPGFDVKKASVKYGDLNEVTYNSTTTGTTRKCYVITPGDYDKSKKYPVLYLLHGIGGTNSEWLGGNPVNVIGNLISEGEATDMVVVIPNVRASADDSVPKDILGQQNITAFDNFINDLKNDLMPFINNNYSVSTEWKDTAIAGLSMGGRESLFIGFSMADTFAYIGAFSPAPGLLPDPKLAYPGQFRESDFVIPTGKKTPKLILICSGNNDSVVGNVPSIYHQVLEKNGVNHLWYTMNGDHNFIVWKNGLYNFAKIIFK
jgi:enterochelin esterase-like enzyme